MAGIAVPLRPLITSRVSSPGLLYTIAPTAPAVSRFWIFWRNVQLPRPTSEISPLSDPAGGAAQPIGSPTFAISPNGPVIVAAGAGPVPNCPRNVPSPLTVTE